MKMKKQKRKWDESQSPQWKFFQENERRERKGEKRLDITPSFWYTISVR